MISGKSKISEITIDQKTVEAEITQEKINLTLIQSSILFVENV